MRAGETVSRQCPEAKRIPSHPPSPSLPGSSFPGLYVEPLNDARTQPAGFFSILLDGPFHEERSSLRAPRDVQFLKHVGQVVLHGLITQLER